MGQPDGLIAQCNRAAFPVPARSAEGAEERLDRQNLVVGAGRDHPERMNEGIDMIDRERGQARSICQQRGQVAVGTGGCPSLPRTALWSVGDGPDRAEQP